MALKHAVEYAKSDRAECKLCGKKITKGAVRLHSIVPVKGYYSTKWHDFTPRTGCGSVPDLEIEVRCWLGFFCLLCSTLLAVELPLFPLTISTSQQPNRKNSRQATPEIDFWRCGAIRGVTI